MSDLKIKCPMCNQEFPAYDQRGFRNAGFTSHHNRCVERRQQQNDQRDQHASRASRFAWAVRRRLLPARPSSSTNLVIEGQNRNNPQSPLSGSSSSSSSSSSPSNLTDITPAMTPIVPSQASHPKQHFHPRQRHTWNHWGPRRNSRRSALNIDTTAATATLSTILPSTTATTLSDPHLVRSSRSLPVMDNVIDSPTFPLLTAITTMDSATALLIPQTTTHLSNQPPVTSPMMPDSGSPFSFTSMLTTLPLESAPLLPSATISTSSSNSNSANDRNSIDVGYQRPTQTSMDSIPTDWMLGPYHFTTDDGSLYHQQQHQQLYHDYQQDHHALYVPADVDIISQQQSTTNTGGTYYLHDTNAMFPAPAATSSSSTDTLPRSLRSPENLDGNDDEPINYCGYCQPRNGQHDPSCSLMQFIMMDIIGNNARSSSSSSSR